MNTKLNKTVPYLAAAVSGMLLAMCFPGFEVASGLVWIWPMPLMAALWLGGGERKRKLFGFKVAGVAGLSFWLINVKWLRAMGELDTVPIGGAIAAWLTLSLYLALYFAVWGMLLTGVFNPWRKGEAHKVSAIEQKIAEKQKEKKGFLAKGLKASFRVLGFAVLHASLWVVLEWLRGWLFTGFGWNGLGVAFHEVPVMMQVSDLVGVTGIAFVPMLLASVLLQTGRRFWEELRAGKFQAHFEIGISVGIIAAVFAYGINRMAYYTNQEKREISFLLIQENTPQKMKWDEALEVRNYQGYIDSSREALDQLEQRNTEAMQALIESGENSVLSLEYPDFVMLPESAFTQFIGTSEDQEGYLLPFLTNDAVKSILEGHSFQLLFGANMIEVVYDEDVQTYVGGDRAYNAFGVANNGVVEDESEFTEHVIAHGKNHLVPFGEYIPDFYPIRKIMEISSGASFGMNFSSSGSTEPITLQVKGEPIQLNPTVCFEDTVGRYVRKFTRAEQQIIVNVTNDGWFGTSEAALQHVANAKFRAVENRRPLVRAANTGVSGVVDVLGSMKDKDGKLKRIEDETGNTFVKGSLYTDAQVLTTGGLTLYAVAGDWFVGFCALLLVGGVLYLRPWQPCT